MYYHPYLTNLAIAGDGFAYIPYLTEDETGDQKRSATEPQPLAAYPVFDQLRTDTVNSNLSAALSDFQSLSQIMGWTWDPTTGLAYALQNGDRTTAINLENNFAPLFRRLCDYSYAVIYKMHILRVGSDGSSLDVVAQQWTDRYSHVYAPTPGDLYNFTAVESGSGRVNLGYPNMITNADTGAVFSWQWSQSGYCALQSDSGCSGYVAATTENHLTTTAGGSVASDVIWADVVPNQRDAVQPVLQLEDGSFVGYVSGQMLAFDTSGNVKWTVADYPQMATADGGIIGNSGITYDANGLATGQLPRLPTQSWRGNAYEYGSTEQVGFILPNLAATFAALAGGNPSNNGTAFMPCPCTSSLEWVFGTPPQTSTKPSKPDVAKPFLESVPCTETPSQIISNMEGNFSSYADYEGNFNLGLVHAIVQFSGAVSLGATISIHNSNYDTLTGGQLLNQTFDVAVQVTQVTTNGFTFTTLPGHVLYPATITFAANSSQAGSLQFAINVNGMFANRGAEIGYYSGGTRLENNIWNHVLDQVRSHCSQ